ncbi:hypothetical protein [Sulfurimonas sp.]
MQTRRSVTIFFNILGIGLLLFLYGCTKPQAVTDTSSRTTQHKQKVKNLQNNTQIHTYTLEIRAPKKATIKILNIKPKYHKNIILKEGKYLIEVSKPSYKKVKKWISLHKNLIYKVTLIKKTDSVQSNSTKNYFALVTKLEWKNTNEKFSHIYDRKNNLIWALQNSYIDYIKRVKVKHLFKESLVIKGSPWPKLYAAKHDTLVYSGNFRYKGKSLLFKKNNTVTLYEASKNHLKKRRFAKLRSLKVNSLTNSWRIPKYNEIKRYNPFKKYQKYYEVSWHTYKDIKFNLPVLCTKKDKQSYYTNASYSYKYNPRSKLYNGVAINQKKRNIKNDDVLLALEYSQNFALLLPVRKPSSKYDKIIFSTKLSLYDKVSKLTNLLCSKAMKTKRYKNKTTLANKMASRALKMLLGEPKFDYAYYDASRDVIYTELYASSANFSKKITIPLRKRDAKKFKKELLNNNVKQVVALKFKHKKLLFKSVSIMK